MSTETTTSGKPIPVPPAGWHTSLDRARIARRVPDAQHPETTPSAYPLTAVADPIEAARVCAQIQDGSRPTTRDGHRYAPDANRDRRVVKMLDAANCLAAASAEEPDDEIGRWAFGLVHDIREFAAQFVTVPEASRIRPEVPETEAA